MITIILGLVCLVGGFIAGILVGRRNRDKIEGVVAGANQIGQAIKR